VAPAHPAGLGLCRSSDGSGFTRSHRGAGSHHQHQRVRKRRVLTLSDAGRRRSVWTHQGGLNEDTRRPRAPTPLTRRRGAPPCLTRDLTGRAGSRCPPLVHRRAHIYRQNVIKAHKGARRRQSGPRHRGRVHSRSRARRPRGPPSQPVVRSDGGGREDAETRSISQKTS
jgi:hypothetical protein